MAGSLAGIKAGKAFVIIDALDKTGPMLRTVSQRLTRWGSEVNAFGGKLMRSMATILLPVGLAGKTFMGFDDSMRRVEARSRGTAAEMQALREQARELGRETASTATAIGDLQAKLAQKGFNRAQIFEITPHVRNLAEAAGSGQDTDPTVAADLVSGNLRAFKLESSEAARLADVFAAAVNNSNFDLQGLLVSMSEAAPLAKQFGISLEDTVATLAGMTNLNIDPSKAGNAFKVMLTRLTDATGRQSFNDELEKLTGNTIKFVDEFKNLRDLPTLLFEVSDAMKDLGTAEQGELLNNLFGTRGILGANAVGQGKAGFLELQEILMNASGTAARTADEMNRGVGGALRRMWSMFVDIGLSISTTLEPAFLSLEGTVQKVHSVFSAFINLHGEGVAKIIKTAAAIFTLGAALKVVGLSMLVIAPLFKLAGGLTTLFASLLSVVASVAGAVFTLAGAAVGAIVTLFGALLAVAGTTSFAIVGVITAIIAVLWLTFGEAVTGLFAVIAEVAARIGAFLGEVVGAFRSLGSNVSEVFGAMREAFASGQIEEAGKLEALGFEIAFRQAFERIRNAWNDLIGTWRDNAAANLLWMEGKLTGLSEEEILQRIEISDEIGKAKNTFRDPELARLRAEFKALAEQVKFNADPDNIPIDPLFADDPKAPPRPDLGQTPPMHPFVAFERNMNAMESGQAETVRLIARLKSENAEPLRQLNNTAARHLQVSENMLRAIEDFDGIEVLGP